MAEAKNIIKTQGMLEEKIFMLKEKISRDTKV